MKMAIPTSAGLPAAIPLLVTGSFLGELLLLPLEGGLQQGVLLVGRRPILYSLQEKLQQRPYGGAGWNSQLQQIIPVNGQVFYLQAIPPRQDGFRSAAAQLYIGKTAFKYTRRFCGHIRFYQSEKLERKRGPITA